MRMYRWLPGAAATLIGILEVLVLTATGSAAHAATPACLAGRGYAVR
ncbi:MAG TPA: hypothetical protein VK128_09180 [Steroidobacteraceae bacterium]|nr:hypothetical protein [Steroidobacteraceae bacterium]